MGYKSKFKAAEIDSLLEQVKNGGTGGGVPIVDSVDKLSADAPAGSVAVVAVQGSAKEQSFRDLFQPTPDMIDQATGTLLNAERMSSVTSLNIFAPSSLEGLEAAGVYIVPRTFSMTNTNMMMLTLQPTVGLGAIIMSESGTNTLDFVTIQEGTPVVNQEAIDQINATLASDDWCYFGNSESPEGITEAQFNSIDKFVKAISGVPSTAEIYLKKDSWEKPYAKEFEALNEKSDVIPISDLRYSSILEPNVYNKKTITSTYGASFTLGEVKEKNIYHEYILELNCAVIPESVTFNNSDGTSASIIWANGAAPLFTAGFTYLISIANNFGVYSMFPNSL